MAGNQINLHSPLTRHIFGVVRYYLLNLVQNWVGASNILWMIFSYAKRPWISTSISDYHFTAAVKAMAHLHVNVFSKSVACKQIWLHIGTHISSWKVTDIDKNVLISLLLFLQCSSPLYSSNPLLLWSPLGTSHCSILQ